MALPVYLVRHGQSEWNLLRLTQGQAMAPRLTDLGRDQARAAADTIGADLAARGLSVGRILSSDLTRAVETAEILAARLRATVELEPRLREQGLGWLEGRSEDEYAAVAEQHDWSDPAAPMADGESFADVRGRMAAVIADLDPEVLTVLTSHANAIRAAAVPLTGLDRHEVPELDLPNGAVVCAEGAALRVIGSRPARA